MTGRRPDVAEHVREATRSLTAVRDTAADDPLSALRHAVDAREEVDALVAQLAAHARIWHGDRGASWAQIGRQLGTGKQAAQQRYGPAADQLLRETIRADARQPALTPAPSTGSRSPRGPPGRAGSTAMAPDGPPSSAAADPSSSPPRVRQGPRARPGRVLNRHFLRAGCPAPSHAHPFQQ